MNPEKENLQSEENAFEIEQLKQKTSELKKLLTEKNAELALKNRVLEIEAALEKLRSRTMAMQLSNELSETANLMSNEVRGLGIPIWSCGYNIFEEDEKSCISWMSTEGSIQPSFSIPLKVSPTFIKFYESKQNGEAFYEEKIGGTDLEIHYNYMLTLDGFADILKGFLNAGHKLPTFQVNTVVNFAQGNLIFISAEPIPDAHEIFKRFAKVFEQTYTRFLDLQKAEAQTREAQIEAALERVRSASLAMHQSTDLEKVVVVLFDKLKELEIPFDATFIYLFDKPKRNIEAWVATKFLPNPFKVNMPYDEDIATNPIIEDLWYAIENGEHGLNKSYKEKDKDDYYKYEAKHNKALIPESITDFQLQAESWTTTFASEKNSIVGFDNWEGYLTTNEEFQILKRFAKVFEQTYVRFLDLQKAEAQAREAQIQLALERVRARTMAMQKSNELTKVAAVLFQQVDALGIKVWTTGFNVWSEDNNFYTDYITSPQGVVIEPYTINASVYEVFQKVSEAKKRGDEFFVHYEEGEMLKETYRQLMSFNNKIQYDKMLEDAGDFQFPPQQYEHFVFGAKVSLMFITYQPIPEAHNVFKRFGKVFEQTYTRFLDLQKAESQAEAIRQEQVRLKNTLDELHATFQIVEQERQKSDKLLLNILPEETAQELKATGQATPKHYELVSVLFTDFKGFSQIAEKLSPQEVIENLNTCFLALDEICERHNLEKIKTIGDSYMCAGGIPVANTSNPIDCVQAGLEMQAWMANWKAEKQAKGELAWELRLGIHSGAVVAGVIGKNKFAYDIWGDAVNLASRMESSGEAGKVNISGTTYQLVKDQFQCEYRGKIEAKNKGEVEMYFVAPSPPTGGE